LSADFVGLSYYHNEEAFITHDELIGKKITAAWGWIMLGINTVLTGGMIWKILYVSTYQLRAAPKHAIVGLMLICFVDGRHTAHGCDSSKRKTATNYPYGVVLEAIVESALITWFGLAVFGIASLAPQGRITVRWHPCSVQHHLMFLATDAQRRWHGGQLSTPDVLREYRGSAACQPSFADIVRQGHLTVSDHCPPWICNPN
jgi:hypothetical protein